MNRFGWMVLPALIVLPLTGAIAQEEERGVPIVQAPYHLPVFRNEYITLLNVNVPPGKTTGYHIHTGDQVSVNISAADMTNQDLGSSIVSPPQRGQAGRAGYADYRKASKTHKAVNAGTTPFHNISFIFNSPQPWHLTPGTRDGKAAYTQIMDNERVRGWRLVIEPGQSAAAITQQSPGIRIVVAGGDIVEKVPGRPDRAMQPHTGDFFWQDGAVTREVRNTGTTRVELVEFELK
jgi:hypothetical protein